MAKYRYLLVILILAIPIVWIFLLKKTQYVTVALPIYGERTINENGDTIYHRISDFMFQDQRGYNLRNENLDGKIYVANFFFTNCPDICPTVMKNMQFVYEKYKNAPDVKFVSHTVDPKRDTIEALKSYGEALNATPGQWFLVTGSKKSLYFAAEYDYLLATVQVDDIENAFIHSEKLVLIDQKGRIRGFYDGLEFRDMPKLVDDIKALLLESKAKSDD